MTARHGWRGWRSVGAVGVVVVFGLPLVLLVSGSLRQVGLPPPLGPELVPDPLQPGNYERAAELGGLGRATVNSLLVALVTAPLGVAVASLAGFALTQLPRRLARTILAASLVTLMIPLTALLVPRFAIFAWLGLTNTYVPLVASAVMATAPFYVLVYFFAFRTIPRDLYDACQLEALSPIAIWWRVALPLTRPVTAAVAALGFVQAWSSFLDPLIYLHDRQLFTLPLALRSLYLSDPTKFPLFLAGAVLATVPVLILFGIAYRPIYAEAGTVLGRREAR
jgi:multiple sugar transport system permease protein